MSGNNSSTSDAGSLAFHLVTLDMLRNVLNRADKPSEFGGYFAQQLREFTGARHVVLAQHVRGPEQMLHRVIANCPSRRCEEAVGPEVAHLIELSLACQKTTVWCPQDSSRGIKTTLRRLGYDNALVIPLWLGQVRVGVVLLLGLPLEFRLDSVGDIFDTLGSVVGSLLRNSAAYEELEAIVEERTTKLRENEARFRAITENTTAVTLIYNSDHVCTYASPSVERVLGYAASAIVGKPLAYHTHPEDLPAALTTFERAEQHPDTTLMIPDMRIERRQAKWVHIEALVTAMFDTPGINGLVVSCRDISDRKKTERQLAKAKRLAESANQAKSEFLANMSHEIRTPMTAILGFADILLEAADQPEAVEAALTIKENGKHLLEIINDILDLSKIEAGKFDVERIPSSPIQIIDDVVSLMRVRAEAKGLELKVEYAAQLPSTITTDPTRLRQILTNLIGNAVKFTEVGEVRIAVQVAGEPQETRQLRIDVADTGMGMTQTQIRKLFVPFEQGDTSTSRRFGGTGLGLAISKRLAGMLGGDLAVSSEPHVGTTFTVTVDTGRLDGVSWVDPSTVEPVSECRAVAVRPQRDLELNCRILLAEDGPDNQRLLTFILKRAGAQVTVAENGQVALTRVAEADDEEKPFDIVLMDMQMPVMDGYEATRRLRQEGFREPIVALTAHAMAGDREKCLLAGCDDYLTKPIVRERLLELIANVVSRHAYRTPIDVAPQ